MATTISSQRYRDEDIVQQKLESRDFAVSTYAIEIEGVEYRVVVDGHHSLEAAKIAGVEPEWETVQPAIAAEYDYEIEQAGVDGWLQSHFIDSEWYDVATGQLVF